MALSAEQVPRIYVPSAIVYAIRLHKHEHYITCFIDLKIWCRRCEGELNGQYMPSRTVYMLRILPHLDMCNLRIGHCRWILHRVMCNCRLCTNIYHHGPTLSVFVINPLAIPHIVTNIGIPQTLEYLYAQCSRMPNLDLCLEDTSCISMMVDRALRMSLHQIQR
jgi:hypothetical protein